MTTTALRLTQRRLGTYKKNKLMLKRLLILIFVATVGANSAGAVSAQMSGDRCVMSCCRVAPQARRDVTPARLRCLLDCNQPTGTSPGLVTGLTTVLQKNTDTSECPTRSPETLSYIQQIRFPKSPTRSMAGSSSRYLEIGNLLI